VAPNTSSTSCQRRTKAKIELAVDDDIAEQVIEAIANTARTGKIGDGKIFVTALEQAIRIRTGETGAEAV
jgi:nitrogen regulatory protein P-II 2